MTSAVGKALGLKVSGSSLDMVEAIRKGLRKEAVDHVAVALEVSPAEISRFLHVSPRTIHRYKPEEILSLDVSDHLVQICKVYDRALAIFGDRRKALRWLRYPSQPLGNTTPFDLLDTSAGVEMVIDELGRIEYGIFA